MIGDVSVDLWCGKIDSRAADDKDLYACLAAVEKDHAQAIGNAIVKSRYICTRAVLRRVLSRYCGIDAAQLVICLNRYGKPYLKGQPWFFNLSHSDEKLVIAVSNVEIGVDIEICRERKNLADLTQHCFAPEEITYWRGLPDAQKTRAFYQFWTAKEAFVKATGRGMGLGLSRCVINPQQPDRFLRLPEGYGDCADWRTVPLTLEKSHVGSLAANTGEGLLTVNKKPGLNLLAV